MRKALTLLASLLIIAAATGCGGGDRLRQRYDMVYLGQDESSVRDKMGRPTSRDGQTWVWTRKSPYQRASVTFCQGKVCDKSWSNVAPGATGQ